MSQIVGTIIDIKSFLENTTCRIEVRPQESGKHEIVLHDDRKYRIPRFQRELRWSIDNVNTLISDLSRTSVFLGNIILTIKDDHTCEIIDGQQRTTILILLLSWLKKRYGETLEFPTICKLENESFEGFQDFVDASFDEGNMPKEKWNQLISRDSDTYCQFPRIKKIWESFGESDVLNDRYKANALVKNLFKSEINIIASMSNDVTTGIRYFLDVNLKGVRLDTEDIFKAYLFEQDTRKSTKKLWEEIKQASTELNEAKSGKDNMRYPLMKIYEHFFYCDLYLPTTAKKFDFPAVFSSRFGENFSITETTQIGSQYFYKGTHLIEVIQNREYLKNSLERILDATIIMKDIIESEGPTDRFKALFVATPKIDSIDIKNCHNLLQKVLLEKEVIPKLLVLKYILSYLDGEPHSRDDYKTFYSVFAATVLFSIFANKKESDTFYRIVRQEDWGDKINAWLYDYISSHELTRGKLLAAYKCDEDEDDPVIQLRAKSLAAINNYFTISRHTSKKYELKISDCSELHSFLTNSEKYSLEHFIIGEKANLSIKTDKLDFSYEYAPPIKKYRNSLFNYIFIPRTINSSLGNGLMSEKFSKLEGELINISCEYSKKYLSVAFSEKSPFSQYPTLDKLQTYESKDEATKFLDDYFQNVFPSEFLDFATNLLKSITWSQ